MAADKEERAPSTGSPRRSAETEDRKVAAERASRATSNGGSGTGQATRRQPYLIALRQPNPLFAAAAPQSIEAIVDYLGRQEDVEIVARQKPAESQPFAPDGAFAQEIVVARIAEGKAETLLAASQPYIVVERDAPLRPAAGLPLPMHAAAASAVLPLSPVVGELALRIVGDRDQPLAKAAIVVFGAGFPIQAITDDSGMARIALFGGDKESVRAIYVRPRANHWERLVSGPELSESSPTTIRLRPLAEAAGTSSGEQRMPSWNQRLMFMERPANLTGDGIRVGLIDSGCDNGHPALRQVTRGRDLTGQRSANGWTDDALGYGTHAAGLLAATAPDAELHAFKVCPGGRLSDLLAALDECIARELDLVCLSVACEEPSELLDQKLRAARHKGIACIAAATPAGVSPPFPAALPSVLAVGAVGKLGEFPADTCHAQAVMPGLIGGDGVFAAAFTGAGPHLALSAPGVAVVSTVPGGHAALDGTGIAAAEITSLAALVLSHHPLFQGPLRSRTEQRVGALFGLLQAAAVPHFADPLRGGAGVPELRRVPGLFGATDPRGQMPMMGTEPFALAHGGLFAPTPLSPGWQALAQMRAAGMI